LLTGYEWHGADDKPRFAAIPAGSAIVIPRLLALIPVGPPGRLLSVPAAPSSVFLQAARRQPTPYTPVWLMRQAGRYLPEYRAMRARFGFLDLCKNPQAAAEVTLQPVERLGVDAAILFADILLLLEPLGVGLEFAKGEGPVIHRPVRSAADVARLGPVDVDDAVWFVFETVRIAVRALGGRVPLIGFAGAPFTVASYLVEGGASRDYLHTKRLMYEEPDAWHRLMEVLADTTARYLNGQIAAGAQAVQLFDSWVGALAPEDYRRFVQPHVAALIKALTPDVPLIHFGTGTATLLPHMREAGGDVIGLDWRIELADGWNAVGHDVGIQGNLDPAILLARPGVIRERARGVLAQAAGRPGHIFNLGHGVHQSTPVEHVQVLVDTVHESSARRR
jgi:uroporphyrinogen decarboxylase